MVQSSNPIKIKSPSEWMFKFCRAMEYCKAGIEMLHAFSITFVLIHKPSFIKGGKAQESQSLLNGTLATSKGVIKACGTALSSARE